MSKKRKRKFNKYFALLITVWILCGLAIGAGYLFFHLPQKTALVQVQREYAETTQLRETAEMASLDSVRQKAQEQLEDVSQQISKLAISENDVTNLIFGIGSIADEIGLSEFSSKNLKAQHLSTVQKSKIVSEAWLAVEFKASFKQLAEFINRLEQSTPVVFVEEMTIQRARQGEARHDVEMQLSFLINTDSESQAVVKAW